MPQRGESWGLVMVISGTFSTVLMKIQYNVFSTGIESCVDPLTNTTTLVCPFNKPWFGVLEMKLAMSCCLLYLYLRQCLQHRTLIETPLLPVRKRPQQRPILRPTPRSSSSVGWRTIGAISIPACLDLFQTVLGNIGLLWISSSVYQMARGSMIVFSAMLSVRYMNKQLYGYHYVSLFLVIISVGLVGYADIHSTPNTATTTDVWNQVFGLVLIILAQFLCALQIVIEEHLMETFQVTPVVLVGYEGLWGLAMYCMLGPILTSTPNGESAIAKIFHEDFVDAFVKLYHSPYLCLLVFGYIVAVGMLNISANNVPKLLSAIVRSILEAVRTLGVWIAGLVIYYVFNWRGTTSPGEALSKWSWLELFGFALMVYGTVLYKKMVRLPIAALYPDSSSNSPYYQSPFMASMHK